MEVEIFETDAVLAGADALSHLLVDQIPQRDRPPTDMEAATTLLAFALCLGSGIAAAKMSLVNKMEVLGVLNAIALEIVLEEEKGAEAAERALP